MNVVPIAFAFDDNLVFPACVCLSSLMMSAHEDTFYDIFILHSASSGLHHGELDRVRDYYPHCRIQYVPVDDTFDGAYEIRGVTTPTYYRLLIPQLIPQYDKILYSDVDVIFRNDLREVYEQADMGDCLIAGVNSLAYMIPAYAKYYKRVLCLSPNNVFYTGNLIINSRQIREEGLVAKLIQHRKKKYMFQDLDILNVVCQGRILSLPPSFCLTTFIVQQAVCNRAELREIWSDDDIDAALSSGIIHYNGQKPWKGWCVNFDIWWEYYRRSPFYDEKFYFDFFYDKLNELEQLSLWKRVKVLVRYFVFGRQKSRLGR